MRDFAADAATDAAVVDVRHRIAPQRIGIGLDRERGTAGEPNARMVAGTYVGIDAETLAHHPLALLDHLPKNGRHAPGSIQLTLAFRDDYLGSLVRRRQGLAQRVDALLHLVRLNRPHPLDADAAHRALDRIVGLSILRLRPRRWDVLTTGRRGVAVIHDDHDGIVLIEDGISNTAGQAVVPEAAVPHDRYRALAPLAAAQRRPA